LIALRWNICKEMRRVMMTTLSFAAADSFLSLADRQNWPKETQKWAEEKLGKDSTWKKRNQMKISFQFSYKLPFLNRVLFYLWFFLKRVEFFTKPQNEMNLRLKVCFIQQLLWLLQ